MDNLKQQVIDISKIVDKTFEISEEQSIAIASIAESLDNLTIVSEEVNELAKKI